MKMPILKISLLATCVFSLYGNLNAQEQAMSIIPIPTEYEIQDGEFVFDENTVFYADLQNEEVAKIAEGFQAKFRMVSGMLLPLRSLSALNNETKDVVIFRLDSTNELGKEGYELNASENQIILNAATPAGLFYAVQSLKQLLPAEVELEEVVRAIDWMVPAVSITDVPKY